jgi:hypothetical protein
MGKEEDGMSGDYIKTFKLEVEIQENGIIRDPFGWIIGRCDDDWLKLVTRHEMEPNGLTVSERTCKEVYGCCSLCCSELPYYSDGCTAQPARYCPNCGAKVVE